ncbi:MAG: DUF2330 domain-containing protein [Myxococcota bacterium]
MAVGLGAGLVAAGALAFFGFARTAYACGGTFCDNGAAAMPVDQTGENILFVAGDGFVEAHIQIQYDPETSAERFAWVVPVMSMPELSVGSQSFFTALGTATAPAYGFNTTSEPCPFGDDGDDPCANDDDGDEDIKLDLGGSDGPSDPEVVARQIVGAFEMFVLDGGTAEGVMQWLDTNGFAQDPAAEPILAEYLEEGAMFVAFKLAPNADASEVHPVTLRYAGDEPCVPIRLTRIAAVDDMAIRTYFLGDARTVPENYLHVDLNPLRLDFVNRADNYLEVVTQAIDEAGGQAWVTEYAGGSEVVAPESITEATWDSDAFLRQTAYATVLEVIDRGWVQCGGPECTWVSPLLEGILTSRLAIPEGVDPDEVWLCPECYAEQLGDGRWDADAFVAELHERIIDPAQHAHGLLLQYPSLTRLLTTLSPHEMTRDPLFVQNPDLPDVSKTQEVGRWHSFCDGVQSFNLPDGRLVAMPSSVWPDIEPDLMPFAARVEQMVAAGAPQLVTDNAELIDGFLARFNELNGARPPVDTACGDDTGGTSDGGGPGIGTMGPNLADDRTEGCACTSVPQRLPTVVWSALALMLGLGARRRRP